MDIEPAIKKVINTVRKRAPRESGNLQDNGVKYQKMSENHYRVFVDEEVAPYMCYTNEKWEHKNIKQGTFVEGETREVFRTWDNPNEGWWDEAVAGFASALSEALQGELKNG